MSDWRKFYSKTAVQRDRSKEFGPVKVIGKNGFIQLIREIQKHLKNGMRIIDIGCGTGHVLMDIYRTTNKKVKMTGIDNSIGMIKVAKQKSEGIKDISFHLMNAFKTKFKDNTFDIAINRLGAPPKSYKETYRILKKNGLFFLFVTNKGDWKEVRNLFGFKEHLGLKEQLKALKDANFKIIKIHKFSSTEYYRNIEDFAKTLEIIPFNPTFNRRKHAKKLKEYERKYKTYWGIKSSPKRFIIVGKK
jgi:ubiquinone/menaquinone biosynthesis C-methylase UbiE